MADLSVGGILLIMLKTAVIMLPAMTANTFAPFCGGGTPMDFGKRRRDGRRYLGDGKTWRGFIGGIAGASALGMTLLVLMDVGGIADSSDSLWGPFPQNLILILALATGSLVGDALGSFIKRALNRPRGAKTPLLDQWDYLMGAALFLLPFYPWWYDEMVAGHGWTGLAAYPLIAWTAHVVANHIGYRIGVKSEPW